MISVVFIGFGNVNFHLCKALLGSDFVTVKQIFNRNVLDLNSEFQKIPFTDTISEIKDADIYIMAIPDDAIAAFSESLSFKNKLVVHTSGAVGMNSLSNNNRKGIFYPLQSFSKQREADYSNIPICIEAEKNQDLELLRTLGKIISKNVVEISSDERAKLHLAAVFVNNFVNYLYHIGNDILDKDSISFDLLKPLIMETAGKISSLTPLEAQTGPAKRNDIKTIEKHLHLLGDSPYAEFYELFTNALKKTNV